MIDFEDFKKLDIRIAKIIEAENIEESEKLLKLKINLGEEERQIVAGLGKEYSADDLVNKEIVVLANLEPKKLMGYESQGMLLAAVDDGKPILLKPEKDVSPGTKIS
jgi:methionine--tRNA ligase beta chain